MVILATKYLGLLWFTPIGSATTRNSWPKLNIGTTVNEKSSESSWCGSSSKLFQHKLSEPFLYAVLKGSQKVSNGDYSIDYSTVFALALQPASLLVRSIGRVTAPVKWLSRVKILDQGNFVFNNEVSEKGLELSCVAVRLH